MEKKIQLSKFQFMHFNLSYYYFCCSWYALIFICSLSTMNSNCMYICYHFVIFNYYFIIQIFIYLFSLCLYIWHYYPSIVSMNSYIFSYIYFNVIRFWILTIIQYSYNDNIFISSIELHIVRIHITYNSIIIHFNSVLFAS